MIFADYLSGMGKNAIVRKLTEMEIPTKNGGQWAESAVDKILRNEKYAGNLLLQKTYSENHLTKAKCINHGELPMYYVEDSHEAIIPQEMFEAVQNVLAHRTAKYAPSFQTPVFSAFTGKIHCGICGANFRRKIKHAGTKYEKPVWLCATFNTKGKAHCASKQIPEDILMELSAEVLGRPTYDDAAFSQNICEIRVPDHKTLVFVFQSGVEVQRTWENKSRCGSWTAEMKENARQSKMRRERGEASCEHQKQLP